MKGKTCISKASVKKKKPATFFSAKRPQPFFAPDIQTKLTVNAPEDVYEQEADKVAELVMRKPANSDKPSFFSPVPKPVVPLVQPKCVECEEEELIQRQEKEGPVPSPEPAGADTNLEGQNIDWFEMSRPFYNRGAGHLIYNPAYYGSVLQPWMYNYQFFSQLDLGNDLSTSATNFFTPFAIDSALQRDFPTRWETMDREMGTSSLMINPTIFNFDIHNFSDSFTMPFPLRNIFGLPENPYNVNRSVQRKCAGCEEEEKEKVQKKAEGAVEMKEHSSKLINQAISTHGQPLDHNTKSFMENRFGHGFSDVKIHTGTVAAKSAQSINALAYTSGNDIVFNEGQYSPETHSGKKLLAHELTHVIQQGNGIHGNKVQKQDGSGNNTGNTPSTNTPQSSNTTVKITANCSQKDVVDIVNQSLTWLDEVYKQLLEYDADEAFKDSIPPGSNHARIAGALQQAFNTTDAKYAEVIRRRFLHIAQTLRTNGKITIDCNGQHCTSGGSSFTAAFVSGPYALTMCSVGTSSSRPIATFIHELTHAILPQIGISADVTTAGRVRDRAYRGNRVFQHLSPEETLDNADSYGILAELLHARANTQLVAPQADTTQNCNQPQVVLEAFARADQWHNFALGELDLDVTLLQGNALKKLNAGNLAMLNRAFPNVKTTAQLTDLRDAFQLLKKSGFDSINPDFKCVKSSDTKCGNSKVYSGGGKVTESSVTLQKISIPETVRICPDWFSLSGEDKIRTLYVAFMIGRPAWIVAGFQLQKALDVVDGAKSLTFESIPAPTTKGAEEHIEHENKLQQKRSKNVIQRACPPEDLTAYDKKAVEIRQLDLYKNVPKHKDAIKNPKETRETAEKIITQARTRDNCKFYIDHLHTLFSTPEAPPAKVGDKWKKVLSDAAQSEEKRLKDPQSKKDAGFEESLSVNAKKPLKGNRDKIYYIDDSDLTNIVVKVKVKLNGDKKYVDQAKKLQDGIEKEASIFGYTIDLEFVNTTGKDVFEADVNPTKWPTAGNWVGDAEVMAHELHHLLNLPDRYNYIESHAGNEKMYIGNRIHWFWKEFNRQSDPNKMISFMGKGSLVTDEDICTAIQSADVAACVAQRKSLRTKATGIKNVASAKVQRLIEVVSGIIPPFLLDPRADASTLNRAQNRIKQTARLVFKTKMSDASIEASLGKIRNNLISGKVYMENTTAPKCRNENMYFLEKPRTFVVCPTFNNLSADEQQKEFLRVAFRMHQELSIAGKHATMLGQKHDPKEAEQWAEFVLTAHKRI